MKPKIKYQCLKCKFKFSLTMSRTKKCPNCGSDMVREVKGVDNQAQNLINNSKTW
jgi:rRNA maturation endonuclease Nob1